MMNKLLWTAYSNAITSVWITRVRNKWLWSLLTQNCWAMNPMNNSSSSAADSWQSIKWSTEINNQLFQLININNFSSKNISLCQIWQYGISSWLIKTIIYRIVSDKNDCCSPTPFPTHNPHIAKKGVCSKQKLNMPTGITFSWSLTDSPPLSQARTECWVILFHWAPHSHQMWVSCQWKRQVTWVQAPWDYLWRQWLGRSK